jgi:hypothetical protein
MTTSEPRKPDARCPEADELDRLSNKEPYQNIRLTLRASASRLRRLELVEARAKEIHALCGPDRERPLKPSYDDLCFIVNGDSRENEL